MLLCLRVIEMTKTILKTVGALSLLLALLPVSAKAEQEPAQRLYRSALISSNLITINEALYDDNLRFGQWYGDNATFTVESQEGIGSLYLCFTTPPGQIQVTNNDTGETTVVDRNYLREFMDMEALFQAFPESVTVTLGKSGQLSELGIYTPGEVPDTVQKWQPAKKENVDMMLLSTHSDDDMLFLLGILPYYAGELGYEVQVVYFTDHHNWGDPRCIEALDGLWTVGVHTYPVFGPFPDYYSTSRDAAVMQYHAYGTEIEDIQEFVVAQLRRFKPMVAIGHDLKGEYGHGSHCVYAECLAQASELANDPERFPDSAASYGLWDTPKTYLHLYPENEIVLDWDQPLAHFGGRTAFQMSQEGFRCHKSQFSDFYSYSMNKVRAADITIHSPCYYGLYRSTVGPDVNKNDFMENIPRED